MCNNVYAVIYALVFSDNNYIFVHATVLVKKRENGSEYGEQNQRLLDELQ
jgi:hypothetical protein